MTNTAAVRARVARILAMVGVFAALFGVEAADAQSPRRFALVVGNSAYEREPIPTGVEDALLVKGTLEGLGFRVDYYENVTRAAFLQAIQQFESLLRRGDIAVFYFAGHGVNVDGNNYLVPLGARIFSDTDATFEAIPLNRVTESFSFSDISVGLSFVEASYDNLYRTAGRSIRAGMTPVSAGTNTLVAFASGDGQPAIPPGGVNSHFTRALTEYMGVPGVEIHQLLTLVRRDVSRATGSRQLPFTSSSLLTRFTFLDGQNTLGLLNQPFFSIRVDGTPQPVEVYANGRLLGVAPLLRALAPGEYELEIVHERYEPYLTRISGSSGEYVHVEPALQEIGAFRSIDVLRDRTADIDARHTDWTAGVRRRRWGVGLVAGGMTNLILGLVALPVAYAPWVNQYYAATSFHESEDARWALRDGRRYFVAFNALGVTLGGIGAYLLAAPPRERVRGNATAESDRGGHDE